MPTYTPAGAAHSRGAGALAWGRSFLLRKTGLNERSLTFVCASLGLALMFSGIWLGDAQFVKAINVDQPVLAMRLFSAAIYGIFLLSVSMRLRKRTMVLLTFFGGASLIGLVGYLAALLIVFAWHPDDSGMLLFGFGLSKLIGAPLSVGLVCVFSQLDRADGFRASVIGMLGAFLCYSGLEEFALVGRLPMNVDASIAMLLLMVACALGMLGMNDTVKNSVDPDEAGVVTGNVVRRPLRQVVTPGVIIMMLVSAMMLGYLRSAFAGLDVHMQPSAVAGIVTLLVVAFLWRGMRLSHVFNTAIVLVGVGVLLSPVINAISPNADAIICNLATALFEVVTWSLVVWTAHNSIELLSAATGMRFLTTTATFWA